MFKTMATIAGVFAQGKAQGFKLFLRKILRVREGPFRPTRHGSHKTRELGRQRCPFAQYVVSMREDELGERLGFELTHIGRFRRRYRLKDHALTAPLRMKLAQLTRKF